MARGEGSIPEGEAWLGEVERRRAASMRFTKRRTEYLLRRLAGKSAVAASLGLPDDPATLGRIAVLNAPTGAPYVQVDGERLGLDVSLTDRAGWAVCLVDPDLGAVGCDLEIVEPRSPGFVTDFLTSAEREVVGAARPGDEQAALANLVWSAKESALKVLRTGLRADTRSVEVTIEDPAAATNHGAESGTPTSDPPAAADAGRIGWRALTVRTAIGVLPGWWRRDGVFLLTVVSGTGRAEPPSELPGSAPLALALPMHTWQAKPLVD